MNFDVNRLSRLAGIGSGGRSRPLHEAGNRSMHDDPGVSDEADYRYGKGQLAEDDSVEEDFGDPIAWLGENGEGQPEDEAPGEEADEDVVLEIDENMLRREIIRMKHERLQESKLRRAIRNEVQDIFKKINNDSSWVYGNRKPRNSRKDGVSMGFVGIGFEGFDNRK